MDDVAIQARSIVKDFGSGGSAIHAVRGVDLDIRRGEIVLIMGPSGSGKTTLLSVLGAMLPPTSGTIVVDGVDLTAIPHSRLPRFRATTFGFVFQDFALLSILSARENVELVLQLAGSDGRIARTRAESLLGSLGLADRLSSRPGDLSAGQRQRVALGRALANDPPIVLADEPTANLDSAAGGEIASLVSRSATDDRRTVVIVSHDHRLEGIADRVLWLEDGVLVESPESPR
jgi:putative ABC transport system ATP-binding protein